MSPVYPLNFSLCWWFYLRGSIFLSSVHSRSRKMSSRALATLYLSSHSFTHSHPTHTQTNKHAIHVHTYTHTHTHTHTIQTDWSSNKRIFFLITAPFEIMLEMAEALHIKKKITRLGSTLRVDLHAAQAYLYDGYTEPHTFFTPLERERIVHLLLHQCRVTTDDRFPYQQYGIASLTEYYVGAPASKWWFRCVCVCVCVCVVRVYVCVFCIRGRKRIYIHLSEYTSMCGYSLSSSCIGPFRC
jgi:hypothetical protein